MNQHKKHRKHVFVSMPIQGSILARCAGYWVVYHIFLWHVMFCYAFLRYQGELAAGAPPQTFLELYGNFARQHYSMLVCCVAVLPVLAWDLVLYTHHIAGPLVRVRNDLLRLSRDESVSPIRLRKGDLMHEVVDAFNLFIEHLDSTKPKQAVTAISDESATLEEIHELQSEVNSRLTSTSDAKMDQILLNTEEKWG